MVWPFEIGHLSLDRGQYRLQIYPTLMIHIWDKRNAIDQKPSKFQEILHSEIAVFWAFLEWCKRCQTSFFTRHRSCQDTSFDIKLSRQKNSGAKLAWTTLSPTLPSHHWSYPIKTYNVYRNDKNGLQIRVQLEKLS